MTLAGHLIAALSLLAASFVVFQVIVRRAYLRRGRLGVPAALLQTLIWAPFFTFP